MDAAEAGQGTDEAKDASAPQDRALATTAQRPMWIRVVVTVVVIATYSVYVLVAAILLWASGWIWGVPAVVVGYLLLFGPAALLGVLLWRRFASRVLTAVLLASAAGASAMLLNGVVAITAPPASVLAGHLDEIGVPEEWTLVDESAASGANCFDVCPRVCRQYQPVDDPDSAIESGVDWFNRHGYGLERVDFWPTPRYEGRAHQHLTVQVDRHYEFRSNDFTEVVDVCLEGREVP